VTSLDHRIRLFDLKDHSLSCKFRGTQVAYPIHASFKCDVWRCMRARLLTHAAAATALMVASWCADQQTAQRTRGQRTTTKPYRGKRACRKPFPASGEIAMMLLSGYESATRLFQLHCSLLIASGRRLVKLEVETKFW
jgi:hypothetical protein